MAEPIRVLIIDDEPGTVSMIKMFLELFDCEVRGVLTGEAGIMAIGDYDPHVVILDLMLPDADGYEICRALRSYPNTRALPIIMLSARTSQKDVRYGYSVGATRYLKKPVSLDKLVEEVRTLAEKAKHVSPPPDQQEKDAVSPPTGVGAAG